MSRNHHVYEEVQNPVELKVLTKAPTKWLLVDRETGQIYVGNAGGHWDKLIPKQGENRWDETKS
jgi:hypothetical protein